MKIKLTSTLACGFAITELDVVAARARDVV